MNLPAASPALGANVCSLHFAVTSTHPHATPLCDTTFVVIDLETTGTSAEWCDIAEVGAVKLRGGECTGTLQALVGYGDRAGDVCIDAVMPALLEFVGDAVLVGHNVAFDLRFLPSRGPPDV